MYAGLGEPGGTCHKARIKWRADLDYPDHDAGLIDTIIAQPLVYFQSASTMANQNGVHQTSADVIRMEHEFGAHK